MTGRRFVGAILVVLGAGLILNRLGIIEDFSAIVVTWWPIALILGSVGQMLSMKRVNWGGIIVMFIGASLLLRNLNIVDVSLYKLIWPVILILVGISLISTRRFDFNRGRISGDDTINYFVMFSGIDERIATRAFKGGTVTALFGGSEIDLRDSDLDPEGAYLEVVAAFGGVNIRVPEDWSIVITGLPIFGGWTNNTRLRDASPGEPKTLKVKCVAVFGGMEIS